MNVEAKRRRAVPKAPRQEGADPAREAGAARAAEGWREGCAAASFGAEGGLILGERLPAGRFVRLEVPCFPMLPCNPSVAVGPGGELRCLVRAVNYELGEEDGIWFRGDPAPNTVNWIADIKADMTPGKMFRVEDGAHRAARLPCRDGLEDGRLFWFRGRWRFTASGLHHGPRVRTTMALCTLDEGGTRVEELEFLQSPHGREMEKNWMPRAEEGRLSFVYTHHPAESYTLWPTRGRLWLGSHQPLHGWSGGSQVIPHGGAWLGVVHQRRKERNRVYYAHRLVRYDDNLEPTHAGREFYFLGRQVEFCAGLAAHDGGHVLSFGVKDREAWLVRLTPAEIEALLA
ncbi:MAG: hypothetical protein ACO3V1_09855 [Candidatus Nanopelagicales bacterium]